MNNTCYKIIKGICYAIFKVLFRTSYYGVENIPKEGAIVIASNHISLLDPPVIGVGSPRRCNYMAKAELFVPVLGTIYKALGAFPVKRGGADRMAIKHGIDILLNGECLNIFPEGTRSKDGKLGKAAAGALMMASKARATIVPCCIIGSDIKRSGRLWPKITVRFGKPIPFPEDADIDKNLLNAMTDEMMLRIAELQKQGL